jgi:hypothetical protein
VTICLFIASGADCGDLFILQQVCRSELASRSFDLDLAFDLDLKGPIKPRWPNAGFAQWVTRQDAGLAATRPWMADRGGPTEQGLW